MFAQEPPPDFDVPGRREPSARPELVAEVGLVEVACATGEVAPVDRSSGVDREHGGGEAVGAGQPLRRDADELLEPLCQMSAADTGCHAQVAHQPRRCQPSAGTLSKISRSCFVKDQPRTHKYGCAARGSNPEPAD